MFKLQKVHSEIKSSLEVFCSWFQIWEYIHLCGLANLQALFFCLVDFVKTFTLSFVAVLLYVLKLLQTIQQDLDSFGQVCKTLNPKSPFIVISWQKFHWSLDMRKICLHTKLPLLWRNILRVHRTLKLVYISINELNSRLIHICKRPGKLWPVLSDYSDSKTGNFLTIMPFQVLYSFQSPKRVSRYLCTRLLCFTFGATFFNYVHYIISKLDVQKNCLSYHLIVTRLHRKTCKLPSLCWTWFPPVPAQSNIRNIVFSTRWVELYALEANYHIHCFSWFNIFY